MAFRITSSNVGVGWQPIATASTTQNHALGTIVHAEDPTYGGGEFIYLKGVASTAAGSWVQFWTDDGSTALLTTGAVKGQVGVAMAACTSGAYGWYQIAGKAVASVLSSCADNVQLYACATPGSVDDASDAGDRIIGVLSAQGNTATTAANCEVELYRPYTDGNGGPTA